MSAEDLLIVAGEASGDLHAARLLTELRALEPELRAFGLGGDQLRAAGCDIVADAAEISVVGIVEVAKIYRRARQIFDQLLAEVERRGARLAVLVDFPEFNLRMARALHDRGVRVVYYISPQLWAWRKGRIKTIQRHVDRMLVLFPFEEDFYREHGVPVEAVGHPLVDEVPTLVQAWDDRPMDAADPTEATIALLPGSRPSEVGSLLPPFLGIASRVHAERPIRARLIEAPTVPTALYDELLAAGAAAATAEGLVLPPVERVRSERFVAVAGSHLALCASGTATLETALLGTPMLVLYRLKTVSYWLARWLVDLPHFSMVNLVLGEDVVPELLQDETRPEVAAPRVLELLGDRARIDAMRSGLARLRPALGSSGASRRAAAAVANALATVRPAEAASESVAS